MPGAWWRKETARSGSPARPAEIATIAREVADITIAGEDLREVVLLRRLSELLMKRIARNYRFVMGFNGMLILLGALGILPPAVSALLHNSSTLLLSMDCLTDLQPQ